MFPFTVSKFIWISRVSLVLLDKLFRCSIFKVLIEFVALVKQLIHYITSLWVCQAFFQNFFWFFSTRFILAFLRCNFYIISYSFAFVKTFFKISFGFSLTHLFSCMIPFICFLFYALHFSFSVRSLEYLSVRLAFGYSFVPLSWVSFIIIRFSTAFVKAFFALFCSLLGLCISGSVVLCSVVVLPHFDCIDLAAVLLFPLVSADCFAAEKYLGVSRPPGKRAVFSTKAAA